MTTPRNSAARAPWDVWAIVRVAVSTLTLMTAAYYLLVAFDNITNPASNWAFVQGVLSGDGTPAGDGFQWREIHATWFQIIAYIALITFETLTGLIMTMGGISGLRARRRPTAWASAQRWTVVGCTSGLAVFFLGFIIIGGNWFIMYLNSKWNGLDPAFQNSVMTVFTLACVLIVLTADRLSHADTELTKSVS